MAHISSKATEFITALVKHLQAVCHGHFDFDENIKVVGHLYLTVDSCSEFNYVLNEKVSKTDKSSTTFVSRSFYATDPQQKPLIKAELNENMTPPNQNQRQQWQNLQESQARFSDQRQKQPIMKEDIHHAHIQNQTFQKRSSDSVSPVPMNKMPRIGDHGNQMQQIRQQQQQQQQHMIYNRGAGPNKVDSRVSLQPQIGNNAGEFQKRMPIAQSVGNKPPIKSESFDPSHDVNKFPKTSPSLSASTKSPAPKSNVIPFSNQPNTNNSQVVDVDLTKVKEEPQDEQYSLAEQKAFAEAEAWNKGEEKYEEDYDEEACYDEEGYRDEEYGEEEYAEGYEEESNYEFMTGLREKSVDLYPVGFVNPKGEQVPVGNHPSVSLTSASQPFVQNLRNPTSQGAGPGLPFPIPPIAESKKICTVSELFCDQKMRDRKDQSSHIENAPYIYLSYKCNICQREFLDKESINLHINNHVEKVSESFLLRQLKQIEIYTDHCYCGSFP